MTCFSSLATNFTSIACVLRSIADSFITYLLLLLLPLPLYLIFCLFRKRTENLPPGSDGWPVLGESIVLALSGLPKFIKHKMENYCNEVFRTSLLGEKFVVFCGPKGNKFVFSDDDKLLTPWLPQSYKKVVLPDDGENSYHVSLSFFHSYQQTTLHHEALKCYVPVMDSLARQQLENHLKPNTVVEVYPLVRKYIFDMSCRLFISVTDPNDVQKLWDDPFHAMCKGVMSLHINLPGTPYNRAIKAGKAMRADMKRIVQQRRKEMMMMENKEEKKDFLSKLLTFKDEDGEYVSDEIIAKHITGLFTASFDSTSSSLAVLIYILQYLAKLPHIYEQVLNEQMAIAKSKGPDEELAWEDFEKMKYAKNVHNESLRVAPAPGTVREVLAEFNYAGFTIPKGFKILVTPHSTHNNPDYFPEPEMFDPSRFEGSGPAPYTFIPFGGGARMCPGRNYAKLAILVFIHYLVTRFRLEETTPNEEISFNRTTPAPARGLPLRFIPHRK